MVRTIHGETAPVLQSVPAPELEDASRILARIEMRTGSIEGRIARLEGEMSRLERIVEDRTAMVASRVAQMKNLVARLNRTRDEVVKIADSVKSAIRQKVLVDP